MKGAHRKKQQDLAGWLALETVIVTLASAAVFILLHIWGELYWGTASMPLPLVLWGLVIMGTIVWATSTLFSRHFNHLVSGLTRGLRAAAEGDFTLRLDPGTAGPLSAAYEDFNKMGEELQGVQTLRSDFIDHFSHEFKTPITAVKGFAELLREGGLTQEEREEYLQIIIEESTRLSDLANSALLLSKLESQQYIAEKRPYPLDEQIKRCAILLSPAWEKKTIAFSAELEPMEYDGNEALMRHVWINLLSNAVKYTPEGGEISVSLQAQPGEAVVTVSDTGIGMSEEVQAHIFDKYYQGGGGKGLGLGLSIVHRIVELCGGSIQVRSAVDQGSAFTVRLPLRRGREAPAGPDRPERTGP